jgi:peptidoglycan/xylan/chitin deacetylase (PgdA/CDA1 family)
LSFYKRLILSVIPAALLLIFLIPELAKPAMAPIPESAADEPAASRDIFLPVMMYHGIVNDSSKAGEYIITPQMFEADMEYLLREGYTTVFASDVLNFIDNGAPLPEKPVLVTFDDVQCGVLHYAKPIMERMGLKAVINIEGAYTERSTKENDHSPVYSYLTWDEVRALGASGLFEIGNHTYDMHSSGGSRLGSKRRPGESLEAYAAALRSDIGKLQRLLTERCGVTPNVLAYPFGFMSEESKPILHDMGFRVLLTCYEKPNFISAASELPLVLHRFNRSGSISTQTYMSRLLKTS